MVHQEKFAEVEDGRLSFINGYCDFNGNKSVINKRRKYNKKYIVYDKFGKAIIKNDHEQMKIIDQVQLDNERIVFYIDSQKRVSFFRTKQSNYSIDKVINKVEQTPIFRNMIILFFSAFYFIGIMRFRNYDFNEAKLTLGYDKSIDYKINFLFPVTIRSKFRMNTNLLSLFIHLYWVRIPIKDIYKHYVRTSDINTPIYIRIVNPDIHFIYNMKSNVQHKYNKKHYLYNTRSLRLKRENMELFIRKSITGQYVIVTTNILNKTVIIKEYLAYFLGKLITSNRHQYNIYFEKFAAGASESAFELFKHAYSQGDQCIYVLDRNHPQFSSLKSTFKNALVAKNSFASFYYIFLARSFISSDLSTHIQRRLYDNDYLIKKKILENKNKIFLQHGVSLATNVFERGYYNRKVPISPDYVLVNSKFEMDLFIDKTNYGADRLIPTGLPNLDLYFDTRNESKEEITFMLTWRPWDLTGDIKSESYLDRYFSFLKMIEEQHFYANKKVNVILHPKSKIILQDQFPQIYEQYKHLFYEGDIKEALIRSKVLISDYSSVVFYAFAGGSNIIFYWEDKVIAEREYGAPNILQKEIAFGDIAYRFHELQPLIEFNYSRQQSYNFKYNFTKLVEYNSGNNTENTYRYIYNHIFREEIPVKALKEKQSFQGN
ncbi:CDP-glycerol glycerophosphotransferase, TagB/SpsB family [Oceanobacillus limi]|uniref:CDP-glycerol glycerophosphotransferase, TagB/SpsB family n=1 Tax=Oceanobacillus limi TaxID=930131 RepID=A0A1I0A200_9BACI|nr:CDP-glycerol glycerophosphotransferase family protein [Oceanobacillus limi]SES88165.1 CDP-glycerol glycerophosphotransferase, TagB/SpsB family [Oceanobacillus limi]